MTWLVIVEIVQEYQILYPDRQRIDKLDIN